MALDDASTFRLSLPYTVIPDGDRVHLIAGEDARTTLKGHSLGEWLPALLDRLPTCPLAEAIGHVPEPHRALAKGLMDRLFSERMLVETSCPASPSPTGLILEGSGAIRDALEADPTTDDGLCVLCQDRLDYDAVLEFQRERRDRGQPWLWATYGPMARGFVSPVFLPRAGPCFRCLLSGFVRLSPAPEIYEILAGHRRKGGEIRSVPFPAPGTSILAALVAWKASLLGMSPQLDAVFRLHVLEADSLEVTSHRVLVDPECPVCGPKPGAGG